jgi:hypothetical protein
LKGTLCERLIFIALATVVLSARLSQLAAAAALHHLSVALEAPKAWQVLIITWIAM